MLQQKKKLDSIITGMTAVTFFPLVILNMFSLSHRFWKMATTFTGPKLQGLIGHFGTIAPTDIEGYVELPDGKVCPGCG